MKHLFSKFYDSRNAVFGLFLVLSISLMFNTFKVIQKNYELQQKLDVLADQVALIEVQNQNLQYNIEYFQTDAYLEVEAKQRFNLAEPGEKVVLLEKDGDAEKEELRQKIDDLLDDKPLYQNNFDKWMLFLFGRAN